jgi:hypothetical protein
MNIVGILVTGERLLSDTREQMPSDPVDWVVFKAAENNGTDIVYVGGPGVVALTGADSAVTGFELAAGESTPKLEVNNLDQVWLVGSASDTPGVTYIAMR